MQIFLFVTTISDNFLRAKFGMPQVSRGLGDHFATTVAYLYLIENLSMAFLFSLVHFLFSKGYRTLVEGAFEYEQEEYKKLTPQIQ